MALLFVDGFDYVISGEDLQTKWSHIIGTDNEDTFLEGRRGGRCLKLDSYSRNYIMYFDKEDQTLVFGGAMKVDTFDMNASSQSCIIAFSHAYESSSVGYPDIIIRLDGSSLKAQKQLASTTYTTIAQSVSGVIKLNTWHYVEVKCRIHETLGVVVIKVDGREVINFSGDTRYSTDAEETACILIKGRDTTNADYTWWDDMYMLTDSGEAPTDFLGDCMVDTIYPNGAGTYTEMTPSSGENWECVNEIIIDDTDYVTGELGQKDSYVYQDVSGESTIHGVQLITVDKISEGSIIYKKPLLSIYGNDYSGEESSVGGVKNIDTEQFGVDPESGEVWTSVKINKYEFGTKILTD